MLALISILVGSVMSVLPASHPSSRYMWWKWLWTRSAVLGAVGYGLLLIVSLVGLMAPEFHAVIVPYHGVLLDGAIIVFWAHTWAGVITQRHGGD